MSFIKLQNCKDIWVYGALNDIEQRYNDGHRLFVITDLRFKNEKKDNKRLYKINA